jgi:hypothetical protein
MVVDEADRCSPAALKNGGAPQGAAMVPSVKLGCHAQVHRRGGSSKATLGCTVVENPTRPEVMVVVVEEFTASGLA